MEHLNPDAYGWTVDDADDLVWMPTAELIECVDGKARTQAELEAWQHAIWSSVKDASAT